MQPGMLFHHLGKPVLGGPPGASLVELNLSHSGDLALVAASFDRRLGIDLERIDASRSGQEIAERFFSPREIAALRALPRERQADAFFAGWTHKEAYPKARGDGLSFPLGVGCSDHSRSAHMHQYCEETFGLATGAPARRLGRLGAAREPADLSDDE
jgi:phosphopantetheinyl transferase